MALGATARQILASIVWQGTALAAAGVAIGVVASLAVTRLLSKLVFGISTVDAPTFLGAAVLLITIAAAASFIPALRATRVTPMDTLRWE